MQRRPLVADRLPARRIFFSGLSLHGRPHSISDYEMQRAFTDALIDLGYQSHEYAVRGNTVVLHYTLPHSTQPITRNSFPEALIQKTNRNYCKLYNEITGGYENTPDKLEYLKNMAPKLFEFCLHSLYTRDFYEAFFLDAQPHP